MRPFVAALVTVTLSIVAAPAGAVESCAIEKAAFQESEAGMILAFQPVGSDAAMVSHLFTITAGGLTLDGHIMFDEELQRQVGMVMHNCPEGDATGADIRACTIWQGIVYGIDGKGDVGLVPLGGEDAPPTLLFAGFGASLRASKIGGRFSPAPWDAFSLKGCS